MVRKGELRAPHFPPPCSRPPAQAAGHSHGATAGGGASAAARLPTPPSPALRLHIEGGGDKLAHKMEAVGAAQGFGLSEEVASHCWKGSSQPSQSLLICLGSPLYSLGGETKLLAGCRLAGHSYRYPSSFPHFPPRLKEHCKMACWPAVSVE